MNNAAEAIQGRIDNYSIAGANLLVWLTMEDYLRAPKPRHFLFGLVWLQPTRRQWEEWANDVACRATFAALRDARDLAAVPPARPSGSVGENALPATSGEGA